MTTATGTGCWTTWNNDNATTANCGYNLSASDNSSAYYTKARFKAQAPLGSGLISKLAQKADDLGLKAKCYNDKETAFVQVRSFNNDKVDKLNAYATELGFKRGTVNIKGEACPCYL